MIYKVNEHPHSIKEWILYPLQQVFAVFVATVLIANICGTPINACFVGACVGTILYQIITKFQSPMFISSCGATVSAVIGALAMGDGNNYTAVMVGGFIIFAVYTIFAMVSKIGGTKMIIKIFPPTIVGAITIVIGANLATFLPTYTAFNGEHSDISIIIAVITMITVAVSSHYFKGFLKTIPFLIGLIVGYVVSVIVTLTTDTKLIDFAIFSNLSFFSVPDFTFLKLDFNSINIKDIGAIALMFIPVAICSMLEHISDHQVLSNIIGEDLTKKPGLHRTLVGDGFASFIGTITCGLPNTSYGESIATIGFSKVASVLVTTVAAIIIGLLGFIEPVQVLIASVPACVFGGCAMVLYGYIAASGLKTIINNKVDLENNKNLIIVSVILTVGVSGIYLFDASFAGVALAMILGIILDKILK